MKVAITATAGDLQAAVDQRFGRARYLLVVDLEAGTVEMHDNEVNLNAVQGAGIQTAQNVARLGVEAVLTGHLGPNAHRALAAAGVAAYTGLECTAATALAKLKSGKLTPAAAADVEGHWV